MFFVGYILSALVISVAVGLLSGMAMVLILRCVR